MRKVIPLLLLGSFLAFSLEGQVINKAEYFFDNDPGTGNGTAIAFTPGTAININFNLNISSLSLGFHVVNIRVRDSNGLWSHFQTRTFYIFSVATLSSTIVKAEYFFDTDPGSGNGINIPITAAAAIDKTIALPIGSLTKGFHTLNVRTLDNQGRWTHFSTRTFLIITSPTSSGTIVRGEYFLDTDPGSGIAVPLPLTSGNPQNKTFAIDINSLAPGFHTIGFRFQDNLGRWSLFSERTFYVIASVSLASNLKKIEYFVDADPGIGLAINVPFTPASSVNQLFALALPGLPSGAHKLFVRTQDNKGTWSTPASGDFTVLACIPPTAPTSPGGTRCNSGTLTLTASGASGSQVYRWYADPTTTSVSFTGSPFTTPALSATTTYYVTVFDPGTLCESSRTSVVASVVTTTPPLLNVSGTVTICQGNSITLIAPAGFSNYVWSTAETTQQIVVNTAGNYTVTVGNGTCQSLPSLPANISLSARPAKPTITSTGSICSGPSLTLQGPSGFASYLWSNGTTTQQAIVNQAGSYSLIVGNVSGCTSVPSDPIAVNGPPLKPSIFVVGSSSICQGESVTLVGPSGFAAYLWSSGASTQQLTTGTAGNYTLQVTDVSGCTSPVSDPTLITVNPAPAKPIVTVAGNPSFCLGQFITLSGPPGLGYVWSTGSTTQDIIVNQSGTFTLVVRDTKGCLSTLSDPVIATASPCGDSHPPAIQNEVIIAPVEGVVTKDLIDWFSDPDNDLDLTTLSIVRPLTSGASASLDGTKLTVDFTGSLFSGEENLTLEVCDLAHNCTRKDIVIQVVGEVVVYNAVSPNGDGLNEVLFLEYIDVLEEAKLNRVRIFNRWGDVVYEAENYNNSSIAFKGIGTSGDILPTGTYFYRIDFTSGIPYRTGFVSLRK